jgi:hypothetical protein
VFRRPLSRRGPTHLDRLRSFGLPAPGSGGPGTETRATVCRLSCADLIDLDPSGRPARSTSAAKSGILPCTTRWRSVCRADTSGSARRSSDRRGSMWSFWQIPTRPRWPEMSGDRLSTGRLGVHAAHQEMVQARAPGTGACGGTLDLLAHARQPMLTAACRLPRAVGPVIGRALGRAALHGCTLPGVAGQRCRLEEVLPGTTMLPGAAEQVASDRRQQVIPASP